MSRPPPLAKVGRVALVVSVPAAAALIAAVFTGAIYTEVAVLCWVLAVAVAFALARAHVSDMERVAGVLGELADRGKAEVPPFAGALGTVEIGPSLARAANAWAALAGRSDDRARFAIEVIESLPDAVLVLDPQLRVRHANVAARALTGDFPAGGDLVQVFRVPAVHEAARNAIASGRPTEIEMTIPGAMERVFLCRAVPLPERPDDAAAVLVLADRTEAKRTERMRADFVANASHEIRTPLAAIAGFVETLLGPAKEDTAARIRFLTIAGEQVARIRRLVEDLLSLSRIEVREHAPPTDAVDLSALARSVAGALAPQSESRRAPIDVEIAEGVPRVQGDAQELEQVIHNLIDNATKYGAGKPVRVSVRVLAEAPGDFGGDAAVALEVADAGAGIPREHIPRLTERFYRVDAARSRELGGTGLGLAIVKHIVSRHRGRLLIESEEGKGSRFRVVLRAKGWASHNSVTIRS